MSPRPYKLGQRQLATDQTRSRIVTAARELLADENGPPGFTVDAVARQAGVARMTVYYQFQSKRGVLEALFDDLANRGLMPHLFPVFQEPVPARALDGLIGAFAAFWNSDRIVLRRARALVALDPEMADSIRERDERRREHLRKIVERLFAEKEKDKDKQKGAVPAAALPSIIDVLHMLTSFETFDALLTGERSVEDVTRIVRHLAATALDLRAG
jgi:AcrR family transcriptional regulator